MALNVKVAFVTSCGFIAGMTWLVSQVARPMVEMPTPLVVRGHDVDATGAMYAVDFDSERGLRPTPAAVAKGFERGSAVDTDALPNDFATNMLTLAAAEPDSGDWSQVKLPPLYVPEAPVVNGSLASARRPDPVPATNVTADTTFVSGESVPEAVVGPTAPPRAALLAALTPESSAIPSNAVSATAADAAQAVQAHKRYKIKPGDTLVGIMKREWKTADANALKVLLAANPRVAKRRNRIFPGEVLSIPSLELTGAGARLVLGEHVRAEDSPVSSKTKDVRWYTIRKRDSLARIAKRMLKDEARWPEIAKLNAMRNAHKIVPGTRIKLPPASNDT